MKPRLLVTCLSALVLVSACSGGARPRETPGAPVPTKGAVSPARLPDPGRSPLPLGTRTLYTGSGHGAGGVTLPASAAKASSVTVRWTCAGPSGFGVTAGGKTLVRSGCGDKGGDGVFSARIPRARPRDLAWRFAAADSVAWRIVVTEPPGR
ncbi:hypothetical protein NX794_08305 [Streptomyces sp. LP11]|uniref:Lipoprotein n=1 Tax=Streptomyces pyxinicus TaxID=2970331 RepID=A0ABT2AZX2_9ACTN|nr:hypothetical protein [Streptomyces sp. LP11]MCS0601233.1 hypothetical protein [Streptomyces sp. LP11]